MGYLKEYCNSIYDLLFSELRGRGLLLFLLPDVSQMSVVVIFRGLAPVLLFGVYWRFWVGHRDCEAVAHPRMCGALISFANWPFAPQAVCAQG